MKQKITSYVMALIMTASLFMSISVNAETNGTITVSDVKATAGSTIAVPVKISNNPGILGATLKITFDEGLTLLDGINGNALASHQMTPPGTFTSPCNFVWDKTELADKDIADGVLLTLKFKTPADAQLGAKYNISVSYDDGSILNKDENSISPTVIAGSIEIMNLVYGDLDCDSNVNTADLVLMRRHVAGGYDQTINELSADVNGDGAVTIRDIIMMRRYIVGGYGVTFPSTGGDNPGDVTTPDEPVDPNTVKFAASDISSVTSSFISVKKEGTSKTTDYKLATTPSGAQSAEVWVNGEMVSDYDLNTRTYNNGSTTVTDTKWLESYNLRGTVTLVDEPTLDSTSGDGYYDRILVTYYEAAQVTNVAVADDLIRIRTDVLGTIEWDPTDTAMDVTIIKDDVEISAEDINEDDIILVKCGKDGIYNSDWAEILVSDKTVTGTATEKSTTVGKAYLLIDGKKYKFDDPSVIASIALGKAYTLYLDAMGYVYDYEKIEERKNIGIVAQMYQSAKDDTPTVVLIDANGDVQTYLTKTTADAQKIENAVEGITFGGDYAIAKLKFYPETLNQRFIEYSISDGKLVFEGAVTPDAVSNGMFKTTTSKLGSYTIDETATTIIDLDDYLNNDGEPKVYPYSSLENENTYSGFVADRSAKTGVYSFAVLTSGTSSLRATSALAVVTSCGIMRSVDGVNFEVLTVARNGEKDIEVLVRDMNAVREGSIIMYTVGSDGYVEHGKLKVIYNPYYSYRAMATGMFASLASGSNLFTAEADNSDFLVANAGKYTLDIDGDNNAATGTIDSDVEIFIAPVYSASSDVLQILTNKEYRSDLMSTVSNIFNTEEFTIIGANVYTYNFDKATGDGNSVSIGGIAQRINTYRDMYQDAAMSLVDMDKVRVAITAGDIAPAFAFVRVNDGDVTDVVYYVAN